MLPDGVQLSLQEETIRIASDASACRTPAAAGLAFDPWRRLYRSLPTEGQVERLTWSNRAPASSSPVPLFQQPAPEVFGDFASADRSPRALQEPKGLAADDQGRLFIAEAGAKRILIYDVVDRRLVRSVRLEPAASPLDLATDGQSVYALLDAPPYLVVLDAWKGPRPVTRAPAGAGELDLSKLGTPSRLAWRPGRKPLELWVLFDGGSPKAKIVSLAKPEASIAVPHATDLEFAPSPSGDLWMLIVARGPDADFERYAIDGHQLDSYLRARGYDGRGIVVTPDGRVGYWSDRGFQHAAPTRARYESLGRVTTFQLDSGRYQTQWGRLFLDACIPQNTDVRVHCITADEVPDQPPLARELPDDLPWPELSPPLPPASWVSGTLDWQRLDRRRDRELPWTPQQEAHVVTYEAPVRAGPGRYLWVVLELRGNTQFTPRLKGLRVEHASHDLLRRLPRSFAREPAAVDFLRRYLAMFEGALFQWDGQSSQRRALLDAWSAPAEALPWLAAFVGLVLDQRWPEAAQRAAIAEAVDLFRRRGTVGGLKRFLEIYLGVQVNIVEKFRLRGLGGARLGADDARLTNVVVGQFRVEGASEDDEGAALAAPDAFATHAHRFSVIIPASLNAEQLDVVRRILDVHRPAHTLYEICTVDAGLRMGRGAYLDLTSIVGDSAGFGRLRAGHSALGVSDVLGRPRPAVRVGSSRMGHDTRGG